MHLVHLPHDGEVGRRHRRWAIEVIGVDRIMFSTDYPFEINGAGGGARRFLEQADLDDADRNKIASGNWDRLCAEIRR